MLLQQLSPLGGDYEGAFASSRLDGLSQRVDPQRLLGKAEPLRWLPARQRYVGGDQVHKAGLPSSAAR